MPSPEVSRGSSGRLASTVGNQQPDKFHQHRGKTRTTSLQTYLSSSSDVWTSLIPVARLARLMNLFLTVYDEIGK